MQNRSELPPGTRFGNDFTILRTLGAGASATVYEAREAPLGRLVALKVLDRALPEMRARFLSEARAMAALRHPSVAEIFRFGEDSATGLPFLAMEPFAGSLADRLANCRVLPEAEAAKLGLEVAEALAAMHGRDPPLVHRDVKPSNILMSGDGRIALADFGLVRRLAPDATALTAPGAGQPGTWLYAAPEQRAGAPPSPAMDWYALGVTLFRCLTGGFPGPGGALPVDVAREVGRGWQPLLHELLREAPEKRLCDSEEIRRALHRIRRRSETRGKGRRAAVASALAALFATGGAAAWALRSRAPAPEFRPEARKSALPGDNARPTGGEAASEAPTFSAVEWTRQYANLLRNLLAKVKTAPVPDTENRIVVRAGEILLSEDIPPSPAPTTIVLDGGALHFSPGEATLRKCLAFCDRFVKEAKENDPVPSNLPPKRRELFRNPISVTENGGHLDHADDAFAVITGPIALAPETSSGILDVFGLSEIVIDRRALVDARLAVTGCGQVADVLPDGRIRNRRWFDPDNPL